MKRGNVTNITSLKDSVIIINVVFNQSYVAVVLVTDIFLISN